MVDMSTVFGEVWQNFECRYANMSPQIPREELAWINELNQAMFAQLEKRLPSHVKMRAVTAPRFVYYTEAAGGYGVDLQAGVVSSYRFILPDATFEERVEAVTKWLLNMIDRKSALTVFFYMPMLTVGNERIVGDGANRTHMTIRMWVTGETVDVEETK